MQWMAMALFLLLAWPCFGTQPGNPGKGNTPAGGTGQGNPGTSETPTTAQPTLPAPIPGGRVTVTPGQNARSLVPTFARNFGRTAAAPAQVTLANINIVRSILETGLTNSDRFVGREIGLWAASHGDFVSEGHPRTTTTTAGMIVAIDRKFLRNLVLGLVGGYGHSWSTDLSANAGYGGAYAILGLGHFYVSETNTAGGESFSTTRAGLLGTAKANSSGWFFSHATQAGYQFNLGCLAIGPYALAQYTLSGHPTFSETGSDAPVSVHADTSTSVESDLGLEGTYRLGKLDLKATSAWEHEFKDTTAFSSVNIVGIPSSTATVAGASLGHNSALVNFGLSYHLSESIALSASWDGQFLRRNYLSNSAVISIRIGF
jgi:uncharacterized protein with beta-barrel porin domain